jgi:glycosyltransferase involved in cell wall biosynthesis
MVDVSVIICTHNPRPHYLSRVLTALRGQTLPMEQWELLVVDNASHVPLTADTWNLSWHPRARLIREEKLGLSAARMRGMREAAADLLVFVDDDNVLEPNYCAEAIQIGRNWPRLGAWGGSIVPEFEIQPAEYLKEFLGVLALREVKTSRWSNVITCFDAQPWGAGLCVRANVAKAYLLHYREAAIQLTGRCGKAVMAGEDVEICNVACSLGLGMGLFPELKVIHLIPKERINEDYLVRITEGTHTSGFLLGYKWLGNFPTSIFSGLGLLRFFKDILIHRGIHRRMYLARLRATINARRIITASRNSALSSPANSKSLLLERDDNS